MDSKTFGKWEASVHTDAKQISRRINASTIRKRDIKIDRDAQTALVNGSAFEPYEVTLNDCSCSDFAYYSRPCKHMYRLAEELGLIDPLPKVPKESDKAFCAEEHQRWEDAFADGRISADLYVRLEKAAKR